MRRFASLVCLVVLVFLPSSKGQFDSNFTLQNVWGRLPQADERSDIQCISADEAQNKIKFSRRFDTGQGSRLPKFSQQYLLGKPLFARILLMPSEDKLTRFGAYQCKINRQGVVTEIVALKLPPQSVVELDAVNPYIVANVGANVTFEINVMKNHELTIRWRHNGKLDGMSSWSNMLKIEVISVKKSDAGIYECYYEGRRNEGVHALIRLIVRDCPAGLFGDKCDQTCPPCYNGGMCHEQWGECVCPAGFTGTNCQQACGGNRFGADCSKLCTPTQNSSNADDGCAFHTFCKPDPYGCSCAPGFKGSQCIEYCGEGWYGADCKQPCHCAFGASKCNRITGVCDGGCASGWRGDSCEIEDPSATAATSTFELTTISHCPVGRFGSACEKYCHCWGDGVCHTVTGHCPSGCKNGWARPSCSVCSKGRFGNNCESTCHCQGGGINCDKDGYCFMGCEAGWSGFTCQQECAAGRFGQNCASTCHCLSGPDVCNIITGKCVGGCQAGFMGDDCQILCPQDSYGENCASNCSCLNGGHCSRIDGKCSCVGRWRAHLCNESKPEIVAATDEEVNVNQMVNISCIADALPKPEMSITSSSFHGALFDVHPLNNNQYQAVMTIEAKVQGVFEFSCSAKNLHGYDVRPITLTIIDLPVLVSKPNVEEVTSDSARITWPEWKFRKDIGGEAGDKIEYMVVYRILGTSVWDRLSSWTVVPFPSEARVTIDHLESDQEYEFAVLCREWRKRREGPPSPIVSTRTKCGVPLPSAIPQEFMTVKTLPNSVIISWEGPSDLLLKCRLTGYHLTYYQTLQPSVQMTVTIQNRTTQIELANLVSASEYTLHLFPVTAIGPSSFFSELVLRTFEPYPEPVHDLQCKTLENPDYLLVTWKMANTTDTWVKSFVVSYHVTDQGQCGKLVDDNNSISVEQSPSTTEIILHSLLPYSTYSISVTAKTQTWESSPTTISTLTAESAPSVGPSNLRIHGAATASSIEYQWDPIPCDLGNGKIVVYEYTIITYEQFKTNSLSDIAKSQSVPYMIEGVNVTVDGLEPFTEYGFAVRGYTNVGSGPFTDYLFHRTAESVPTAPPNLVLESVTSHTILMSWSKPQPANGILQSYNLQYRTTADPLEFKNVIYVAFNTTQKLEQKQFGNVTNLNAANEYLLKIRASTNAGWGEWSKEESARTLDDVPEAPTDVILLQKEEDMLILSWNQPLVTNGEIISYKIRYKPVLSLDATYVLHDVWKEEIVDGVNLTVIINELHPNTQYSILIQAQTVAGYGPPISLLYWTKIQGDHILPLVKVFNANATNESVPISFSTQSKSSVYKYQIIVEDSRNAHSIDESVLKDYDAAVVRLGLPYYIAAELDPENVSDSDQHVFVVGDQKVYGGYRNVHLNPGHEYKIKIRLLILKDKEIKSVLSEAKELLTTHSGFQDYVINKGQTIFGLQLIPFVLSALGILFFIFIVALITLLLVRHEKKRRKQTRCANQNTGLSDSLTWSVMYRVSENEVPNEPLVCQGWRFVSTVDKLSLKRSKNYAKNCEGIKTSKLANYVRESNTHLVEEFKQLVSGQTAQWTIARKSENLKKNRYGNVLPYDQARVVLKLESNVSDSDYINASYIDGFNQPQEYIVTQGPLENTVTDFWRLVWQENAPVIVMLTNQVENGKNKCSKYWPEDSMMVGSIQILLTHSEECSDFVVRTILLRKMDEVQTHRVQQYHFFGWSDRNVPTSPYFLVKMIKRIHDDHPDSIGPMIVHCSAGTGRSGTFIAIDALLQQAQAEKRVDVFPFVNNARLQRINMVQTVEQYMFIYDALVEAVECEDTAVSVTQMKNVLKELGNTSSLEKSLIRKQFLILKNSAKSVDLDLCSSALSEGNIFKNRDPMVIPSNAARVMLEYGPDVSVSENYINAVYVAGYKQNNAYLVTQMPMHHTIEDFWQLIYQTKSSVIVMLNECFEIDGHNVCQYWPCNGQSYFGRFVVDIIAFEEHKDFCLRIMNIEKSETSTPPHKVIQLQYNAWTPGQLTPRSPTSFFNFIKTVESWSQECKNSGPITVHCLDGAMQCGLFCTISYIINHFNAEGNFDAYQAVKKIQSSRPEFMQTLEQYVFCFEVASEIACTYYEDTDDVFYCSNTLTFKV